MINLDHCIMERRGKICVTSADTITFANGTVASLHRMALSRVWSGTRQIEQSCTRPKGVLTCWLLSFFTSPQKRVALLDNKVLNLWNAPSGQEHTKNTDTRASTNKTRVANSARIVWRQWSNWSWSCLTPPLVCCLDHGAEVVVRLVMLLAELSLPTSSMLPVVRCTLAEWIS